MIPSPAHGENKRILLIEDDEDILVLVKAVLESEGYDVLSAQNGQQAINRLRSGELHGERPPSAILLDLMMPLMDGVRFRQEQLKNPAISKIPVVVMSAASKIREKSDQIGVTAYLKKPLDADDILDVVKKVCA